jgi:hypothetical protein
MDTETLKDYLNKLHNNKVTKIYVWNIVEANCIVSYELNDKWEVKTINAWKIIKFLIKNKNNKYGNE